MRQLTVAIAIAILAVTAIVPAQAQPAQVEPDQELWAFVRARTEAFYPDGSPAWVAEPGEWYRVVEIDASQSWVLVYWEWDAPTNRVYIRADARLQPIYVDVDSPTKRV